MKTRLRRPMTATVFMLVAVLVLSNAAQIGARVVCMGSDGHVDVEPSGCTCCAVIVSDDERFDDGLAPTSPSCSDCVDVPLRVPPLKSKAPQLLTPDNCAEGRTIAPRCGGVFLVHGNQVDQHWQSLSSLSTVVLLT